MSVFFVDYSSVRANGLNGLELLGSNDVVYILYELFAKKMSIDCIELIHKSNADIHTHQVAVNLGVDAIALELIARLGYQLGSHPEEAVFVISKSTLVENAVNNLYAVSGIAVPVVYSMNEALIDASIDEAPTDTNIPTPLPKTKRFLTDIEEEPTESTVEE